MVEGVKSNKPIQVPFYNCVAESYTIVRKTIRVMTPLIELTPPKVITFAVVVPLLNVYNVTSSPAGVLP